MHWMSYAVQYKNKRKQKTVQHIPSTILLVYYFQFLFVWFGACLPSLPRPSEWSKGMSLLSIKSMLNDRFSCSFIMLAFGTLESACCKSSSDFFSFSLFGPETSGKVSRISMNSNRISTLVHTKCSMAQQYARVQSTCISKIDINEWKRFGFSRDFHSRRFCLYSRAYSPIPIWTGMSHELSYAYIYICTIDSIVCSQIMRK